MRIWWKGNEGIYSVILEKVSLYGWEIWYRNTLKQDIKLVQIQRSCILLVTKAYKTVSSEILLVTAGTLPIEYSASVRQAIYLWKSDVFDMSDIRSVRVNLLQKRYVRSE